MLLCWTQIAAGWHVASRFTIRRSRYARQWLVRDGGRDIGFRPTLGEAKRMAERNAGEKGRAA